MHSEHKANGHSERKAAVSACEAVSTGMGGGPGEEERVGHVWWEEALGQQDRGGQVVVVLEGDEVAYLPAPIGWGVDRRG